LLIASQHLVDAFANSVHCVQGAENNIEESMDNHGLGIARRGVPDNALALSVPFFFLQPIKERRSPTRPTKNLNKPSGEYKEVTWCLFPTVRPYHPNK